MTIIEVGSVIGALGVLVALIGMLIRNAISIAGTQSKAESAHTTALKSLQDFNDYRVHAAAEFVTHAHLRAVEDRMAVAVQSVSVALDRHTVRLDAILQTLADKPKER